MIRLFYISVLVLSFLIAKESFSTKKVKHALTKNSQSEVFLEDKISNRKAAISVHNSTYEDMPQGGIEQTAQSDLNKPSVRQIEVSPNEQNSNRWTQGNTSTSELKVSFFKYIQSEEFRNDPIAKGNYLMAMSNIEELKPLVRKLAMEVATEQQFKKIDPEQVETEQDLNHFLSDNKEHEAVIMAYQAYLNTYNNSDTDVFSETFDLIEYHQSTIIRRDIANLFIDSYPQQYDQLIETAKNSGIIIKGIKKVIIPDSEYTL